MARFDRTYRLLVGRPGEKGVEIAPPLRMRFEVSKDTGESPNQIKLSVWNLSPHTREAIVEPDNVVALYAGYEQEEGALLLAYGTVVQGASSFQNAEVVTELEVLDGFAQIRDTVVSLGCGAGVRARLIIEDIAFQMGLSLVMADDAPDRVWQNGFSFYGAARVALHKVVQGSGLEYSIQNGELQVIERCGITPRKGFVLSPESGLLGNPERIRQSAKEKADSKGNVKTRSERQQADGWRVTSLLLPSLNPGDLVKLESRQAVDWFRVESLKHSGDWNGSGNWHTTMELLDRHAAPQEKDSS
ncbi:phage protein [Alcaligenes phenolicus]|uniref:phage protein n=1 Tax=Alcaligenes phenolicus TaxID=232846 RepID=UPI003899532F